MNQLLQWPLGIINSEKNQNEKSDNTSITDVNTRYLILSGEGDIDTEWRYCMETSSLEEANFQFNRLKAKEFENTQLFIYEAKKIREE